MAGNTGNRREKGDGKGRQGGRQKGTPNKVTREARETLAPIINKYIGGEGIGKSKRTLEADLECMDPDERPKVMAMYLPYAMPKLSSVEIKPTNEGKSLKDELDELEES